jgi:hypothetical protein
MERKNKCEIGDENEELGRRDVEIDGANEVSLLANELKPAVKTLLMHMEKRTVEPAQPARRTPELDAAD